MLWSPLNVERHIADIISNAPLASTNSPVKTPLVSKTIHQLQLSEKIFRYVGALFPRVSAWYLGTEPLENTYYFKMGVLIPLPLE